MFKTCRVLLVSGRGRTQSLSTVSTCLKLGFFLTPMATKVSPVALLALYVHTTLAGLELANSDTLTKSTFALLKPANFF